MSSQTPSQTPTEPQHPLPVLHPNWQRLERLPHSLRPDGTAADLWLLHLERIKPKPELLSQTELTRAQGLATAKARQLALALRTAQRRILAAYLDLPPQALVFARTPKGKPFLQGQRLHFNLSHSRDKALLAVSDCAELGVDLEWPRPIQRLEAIAERLLEPQSSRHILSLSTPIARQAAFLQAWVCLEARQKLSGTGLFGQRLDQPHRLWLYGLQDGGLIALAQALPAAEAPRLLCWPLAA